MTILCLGHLRFFPKVLVASTSRRFYHLLLSQLIRITLQTCCFTCAYVPPVITLPSRTLQSCSSSGQGTEQESPDSSTHCLQDGLCKGSHVPYFSALRPVLASHSSGLQEHISTGHGSNLKYILVRHPSPFDTRGMLVSGCKMPSF